MARPSSRIIREFEIIEQFKRMSIGAIVNLQVPGEHASCGDGTHPSGFSYLPEEFMNHQNMTVPSLELALSVVQVIAFTEEQKRKIAVHCHAGLGRTGLIIACFLVFKGCTAANAIENVRAHRPGSIQTRKQQQFVHSFQNYVRELEIVFAMPKKHIKFTFEKCIKRQRLLLHGVEQQVVRNIPKIVHSVCSRIQNILQKEPLRTFDAEPFGHHAAVEGMKLKLNSNEWDCIAGESNIGVLLQLMFEWIAHLKEPLFNVSFAANLPKSLTEADTKTLNVLPKPVQVTLKTILTTLRATPKNFDQTVLITKLATALLGYSVTADGNQAALTPTTIKAVESLGSLLTVAQNVWTDSQTTKSSQIEEEDEGEMTLLSSESVDRVFDGPLQLE